MALQSADLAAAGVAQGQNQDAYSQSVIAGWNLMGGLEWPAIPTVCAILDIEDIEMFVRGLAQIRDWQAQKVE